MRITSLSILVIFAIIFSTSCNRNKEIVNDIKPGFEKYISSFTSGSQLSKGGKFVIRFQQSINDTAQAGQEVVGESFEFSPSVKGKAYWLNSQTIEFVPDEGFESGVLYDVVFHLKNFLDVPEEYQVLEYQVGIMEQAYRFIDKGLSTYETNMVLLRYEGEIVTADISLGQDVEKMVEASLPEGIIVCSWKHGNNGKIHQFEIDSIQRLEDSRELEIEIDGDAIGVDQSQEFGQRIPGLNMFEVLKVQAFNEKVQYVVISFSDPLLADQNLKGLVYFDTDSRPEFFIEGSKLKVFPSKKMEGERQLFIAPGVKNALNYKIKEEVIFPISFETTKPALEALGTGVIIPSSTGLIFPFRAVSANRVDLKIIQIYENNVLSFLQDNQINSNGNIRLSGRLIHQERLDLTKMLQADLNKWNTFKIDLADYIQLDPGALYRVELSLRRSYSIYPCDSNDAVLQSDAEYAAEVERNMKRYDNNRYYYDRDYYYYDWDERENPCSDAYYHQYSNNCRISQNLFASNFGITTKGSPNNKFAVVVSDLNTTDPIKGVDILFYNLQKQLIAESKTNRLGICLEQLNSKPYFIVAKKGNERGYLKLDNGESLSLSNFNVSGMVVQKGLKGYIYGERNVWRPGDNIYLTLILEDMENRLPADHPVVFDLINPMGQTMIHKVNKTSENGFYSFHIKTETNAPTGNWTVQAKVGGASFSRFIRIETIKPNRIKATINFDTKLLTKNRLRSPLSIEGKWLHGSPAKNLKTKVLVNLTPAPTTFERFDHYSFLFPQSNYRSEEMEVFSGELNAEGKTSFSLKIPAHGAPGMLNANFVTRVFEKSGEFSILTKRIKYSPYESYVGVKMHSDGQSGWYQTDTKHRLNVVSVDEKGNPVVRKNIKVKMYKISWRWWWNSYNDNLASYLGSSSRRSVSTEYLTTNSKGEASVDIQINYNSYSDNGRYLIVVEDPISGHKTGMTVYFSKWYGRLGGGSVGASMLSFTSDKDKYKVDEEVKITIPSSKNGRALVSLESGSDILDVFWVETEENETQFSFPVTKEMAPNVFVHISLIQPHAQTINDNPIRMYGVIPIAVEDPETILKPKIHIAEVLRPEEDFEVKVSEEEGKSMTYTLAIVDEGLLDITNFKTPDPWKRFYAKEALGIRTWDMYDDVVGAYGARLEKALAIGGDGSEPDPSKNKANRFKPVVIFAGPFTLDKGETQKHKFTMPNYIGSVRVMVVAGNQGAYGNAEKAVPVKKDLMLLATLPRVLGPGEEVVLPVTVFAMNKKIKNVKLSLKTNDKLQIIGSANQTTTFTKEGDKMVYFRLKVSEKLGKATATIVASSGDLKAHYDIELNVRTPNLPAIVIKDSLVPAGKEWIVKYERMGIEGTNTAVLEVSGIPSMGLEWRVKELLGYPHGCIEQTTSKVFPQIFLGDLTSLSDPQKRAAEQNIMGGLNALRGFQLSNGGFSYWPGSEYVSEWGTSYAGHMLIMAERKGYQLPSRMKSQWVYFQRSISNSWSNHRRYGDMLNQAYRLYTLALAGEPEKGAMNRLSQMTGHNERSKLMLALAYAEIGQTKMAQKLISSLGTSTSSRRSYLNDYTYGSSLRDDAIHLMLLTKMDQKDKAFTLVKKISKRLDRKEWLSTQSMAYGLMAVSQYYQDKKPENIKFTSVWKGEEKSYNDHNFVFQRSLDIANQDGKNLSFKNTSTGSLYVRLIQKGVPLEGQEVNRADNLKMNVYYRDMEGNAIDPYNIEQGTDFKAIVEINNPGILGAYYNMALMQIFPSGWEIINTRLLGQNSENSYSDYIDIRDDRVYTYFNISKYKTQTYVVLLNAAYEGSFYLPAVSCSAMYDNSIGALEKGGWIKVIRQ